MNEDINFHLKRLIKMRLPIKTEKMQFYLINSNIKEQLFYLRQKNNWFVYFNKFYVIMYFKNFQNVILNLKIVLKNCKSE